MGIFNLINRSTNLHDAPSSDENTDEETSQMSLPHMHPKILLLDVQQEAADLLRRNRYNVSAGSFGKPYAVKKRDDRVPMIVNGNLPSDYAESEIVVIDLSTSTVLDQQTGSKHVSDGMSDWWVSCSQGVVDSRVRLMTQAQSRLRRILNHQGFFVVFAEPRLHQDIIAAHVDVNYHHLTKESAIDRDNWSFLDIFAEYRYSIFPDQGREITVRDEARSLPMSKILQGHLIEAYYTCTIQPTPRANENWLPLLQNKFGATVGGIILRKDEKGSPEWIFVLPHLHDKPNLLLKLVDQTIPSLCPYFYEQVEGVSWTQRSEYELPGVYSIQRQINEVQEECRRNVSLLEEQIRAVREDFDYLHVLLHGTGTPLVEAVSKSLSVLGFQQIKHSDEEAINQTMDDLREDLQIHDQTPVLLVEIKGLSNKPKDEDILAVEKYIIPRMREWDRTDVNGLVIINHQRNTPPLERENQTLFRPDILTNAQQRHIGLLTTWDLHRLIRNFIKNKWKPENVHGLFFQAGRIGIVPKHYEYIGVVECYLDKISVVGVRIEAHEIYKGDTIAFELPVEFEEQTVDSLQLNKASVMQAPVGELAGIKTHLTKEQVREKTRVYRVTIASNA